MNVELTIQEMYDEYPDLFKDRADCMNQLFCTIGNGMQWRNGELVTIDDGYRTGEEIETLESHLVEGKAFQHNKLTVQDVLLYFGIYKTREEIPDALRERFPDDRYHRYLRAERWYFAKEAILLNRVHLQKIGGTAPCPSEDYAFLLNYPEDIKPDWLQAIEECRSMIQEDGYTLPQPNIH